jgi:SAM-dependent methyltransferase
VEAAEYELLYMVEEQHWWYRALRRAIADNLDRFLPNWRHAALLDAGCGTGGNLAHMGNQPRHIGLDLSPLALAFCSRRGLRNLVNGDVRRLPFADGSMDAILSASVLYHRWVPDVNEAVRECRRVLRDDGLLLLDLPAFRSLASPHDEAVYTARRFTRRELCDLLHAHGFQVRRLTYWNTLLFPVIWLLRRSRLSRTGRDFRHGQPTGVANGVLDFVMRLEICLLRRIDLPFGVSISCVASKRGRVCGARLL